MSDTAGSNETKVALVVGRTANGAELAMAVCTGTELAVLGVCNGAEINARPRRIMVTNEIIEDNDDDQRVPDYRPLPTIDESVEIQPDSDDAVKRQKLDDRHNHTLSTSSSAENMEIQPENDGGKHENIVADDLSVKNVEILNNNVEIQPESDGDKHANRATESVSVSLAVDKASDASFDELGSYAEHDVAAATSGQVEQSSNEDKTFTGESCREKPAGTDEGIGTLANLGDGGGIVVEQSGERSEEQSLKESCEETLAGGRDDDMWTASMKDKDIKMEQRGEKSEADGEDTTSGDDPVTTSAVDGGTAEDASKTQPLYQAADAEEDDIRAESVDVVADERNNVVTKSSELTGRKDDMSPDPPPLTITELTVHEVDLSPTPAVSSGLTGNKEEMSPKPTITLPDDSTSSGLAGHKDDIPQAPSSSVSAAEADDDGKKAVAEAEGGSRASRSAESETETTLTSGISEPSASPSVDAGQAENETIDVKENAPGRVEQLQHEQ